MPDNRPRVALQGKRIDLAQLSEELGEVALTANADEVVAVEGSGVTEQQLAAAVAAHRASLPPSDPYDDLIAALTGASTVSALRSALLSFAQARKAGRG